MHSDETMMLNEFVESYLAMESIRSRSFSMSAFKKLDRIDEMLNYARTHLRALSSGSSREVFVLSSSKVLKIAIDELGIEQNQNEVEVSSAAPSSIIARVKHHDDQHRWIVAELVHPFDNEEQFKSALGLRFPRSSIWLLLNVAGARNFDQQLAMYVTNNGDLKRPHVVSFLHDLRQLLALGLSQGELEHAQQWGRTSDGRVVVLDYGLSKKLQKKHFGVAW